MNSIEPFNMCGVIRDARLKRFQSGVSSDYGKIASGVLRWRVDETGVIGAGQPLTTGMRTGHTSLAALLRHLFAAFPLSNRQGRCRQQTRHRGRREQRHDQYQHHEFVRQPHRMKSTRSYPLDAMLPKRLQ